jgi:hypothetical protein
MTKAGQFVYKLKVSLDQLMVRVSPKGKEKWPNYVLLDDYPRTGKVSGEISFSGNAQLDQFSASAALKGVISSLDSVWIESVKPEPMLCSGLTAQLRIQAKLGGTVKCDLPGDGSNPATAIFVWPAPVKYDGEISSFVTEGSVAVFPAFGPRPAGQQEAMIYDLAKATIEGNLPGVGGLTAPPGVADLNGTPEKWELSMAGEAKPELGTGGEYSHHITVTVRLVPKSLPSPQHL